MLTDFWPPMMRTRSPIVDSIQFTDPWSLIYGCTLVGIVKSEGFAPSPRTCRGECRLAGKLAGTSCPECGGASDRGVVVELDESILVQREDRVKPWSRGVKKEDFHVFVQLADY